jgi:hypothetical protein
MRPLGRPVAIVHVSTAALSLCKTDTYAQLKGTTYDGAKIEGKDMVRIIKDNL